LAFSSKFNCGKEREKTETHDIHARKLTPHLVRHSELHTTPHIGLEEVEVSLGGLSLLKLDRLSDSGGLKVDEFSFSVVVTVDVSEDLESLLVAAFVPVKVRGVEIVTWKKRLKRRREDKHEPTRTLREQPHRSTEALSSCT
jgi:hypothetical protein